MLLGFCLLSCWVQFKERSFSFSDNDSVLFRTCNQVKLSIYVSIKCFSPERFSASLFREIVIYCCVTHYVMVQKASFRNCPVRWPFKYDATNEHFEHGCSLTFTDQLIS